MVEKEISLDKEVDKFRSVNDQIALGDLGIRQRFAASIMLLFGVANGAVLIGLGVIFYEDCVQLAAKTIRASDRIVNSQVIMTLLGATTVQLGTVVLTIARAIFPAGRAAEPGHVRETGPFKDVGLETRRATVAAASARTVKSAEVTLDDRAPRTRRAGQAPDAA